MAKKQMIMLSKNLQQGTGFHPYYFITSCIGVIGTLEDKLWTVAGMDIVRAYQLIAEPLKPIDEVFIGGNEWTFTEQEVTRI